MGFLDKAKQAAQQAQAKLDEAQAKFNQSQRERAPDKPDGPPIAYDEAGRPVTSPPGPQGSVAPPSRAAEAPPTPTAEPEVAPDRPDEQPPKLSGGDPLAG